MSELKRDTTIDVTVKEGKEFLESSKSKKAVDNENESDSDSSIEDGDDEAPPLARDSTMAATVKDSKNLLGEDEEYEKTRSGTANLKESIAKSSQETSETTNGDKDKPKMPRDGTMRVTTKEAKDYLGDDDRERTRKQTQEATDNEDKPATVRTNTMAATAEEGANIIGGEDLGKTRSQTEKANTPSKSPTALKRTSTMAETAKEGEEFLKRTKVSASDDGATPGTNSTET